MRWGELAGLRRPNLHLDTGIVHIDVETGALHELSGNLTLGPPKTPASVRDIALPDFLVDLLTAHLDAEDHGHVFASPQGALLRRGGFRRRVWLPAVAGDPVEGTGPIHPRLHFHDLRHTHKTWLIEDGVPEIAQAQRLGHGLGGVAGIYSHVTNPVIERLVHGLERRWRRNLVAEAIAAWPRTTSRATVVFGAVSLRWDGGTPFSTGPSEVIRGGVLR